MHNFRKFLLILFFCQVFIQLTNHEAWTLRKQEEARLQAAEMWFYRRLLSVQWQDKRTNESVLEELSTSRGLLLEINKRRMKYIGHANRNPRTDLMATVLQGRIEGRRNRPPTSLMNNITASSGLSISDVVHRSRDRQDWRGIDKGDYLLQRRC